MIRSRQLRALSLALILPFTVVVHLCPHHFTAPVPLEGYGDSTAAVPQAMAVHTPSCHPKAESSDHDSDQPEDCSCENHPADLASNFAKPVISLPPLRPETRAVSWALALSSPAARPAYWLPDHTAPPLA